MALKILLLWWFCYSITYKESLAAVLSEEECMSLRQ